MQSALIVPIVHQGDVLGTINLYHPQPDAFRLHDRQLLETIAERSAMALHNGLLFERTRCHAFTDPLTGLYNLRYFTEWVENRCARADAVQKPFALLCLDLDSFKPINDNFGHQKGDGVLRDLAKIFLSLVRESDLVARYGGDEFLIILEGAGPREAAAMSARLQAAVEDYDPGLNPPPPGRAAPGRLHRPRLLPRPGRGLHRADLRRRRPDVRQQDRAQARHPRRPLPRASRCRPPGARRLNPAQFPAQSSVSKRTSVGIIKHVRENPHHPSQPTRANRPKGRDAKPRA